MDPLSKFKAANFTKADEEVLKGCGKSMVIYGGVGGLLSASSVGFLLTRKKQAFQPRIRIIVTSLSMMIGVYAGATVGAAQCLPQLVKLDTPLGAQARTMFGGELPSSSNSQGSSSSLIKRTEEPDDHSQ